jgi:hypothetical protein
MWYLECPLKPHSVEFQLLLTCLRWPLTEIDRNRIGTLLGTKINSPALLDLVEHHQVAPIVFRNLDGAAHAGAPPELLSTLRERTRTAGIKSFRRVSETLRLVAELARSGIAVRVLKGIAVSLAAYGDATLQDSIDIDLLVSIENVFAAEKVLVRCGYRRIVPLARLTPRRSKWILNHAHQFNFANPQTRDTVELHWALTPNPFKYRQFVARNLPTTYLAIGERQIPTLAPEDMFLHACIHGAEHWWSRLKWMAPIAAMLRAMAPEQFQAIVNRAQELEVTAELSAAVELAGHYGLIDGGTFSGVLDASPAATRIVTRSLRAIDQGPGYSPNALIDLRDAWFAASSFKYRRKLIERTMIREESWNLVDLPDSLFLGYIILSPLAWLAHRRRTLRHRAAESYRSATKGLSTP